MEKDNTPEMLSYYAHSAPGKPPGVWQKLEDHLLNVANLARGLVEEFGAGEWGYLAGLWHDLGKYSDDFQKMILENNGEDAHIENKTGRVDHSTAGAILAETAFKKEFYALNRTLAYVIAGPHAGLSDWVASLDARLQKEDRLSKVIAKIPSEIRNLRFPEERPKDCTPPNPLNLSMWIRMISSCVLDADFLDTEEFLDTERGASRKGCPDLLMLTARYMRGNKMDQRY
jgi:CRISPR-associated endonuclease/helicase Cas3